MENRTKGIFITGTGTDIGKTFVTALIVKKLADSGETVSYYKAAISGAASIEESDAGYVKKISGINQPTETLLSYRYDAAVSPHLAAKLEGNPVELSKVEKDFRRACENRDFVCVEGSGGIICPIRYDQEQNIFLEDVVKALNLETLVVGRAGLGTINDVTTTCHYIKSHGMKVGGIILNHYKGGIMEDDNISMIEKINQVPVIALVKEGEEELNISTEKLKEVFKWI